MQSAMNPRFLCGARSQCGYRGFPLYRVSECYLQMFGTDYGLGNKPVVWDLPTENHTNKERT